MNKFHTDPTGMPGDAQDRLSRFITFYSMTPTARIHTPYGDIFIAERPNPLIELNGIITGGWDVIWGSRGTMQEIEMKPGSTQENRIKVATEAALDFISRFDQRH